MVFPPLIELLTMDTQVSRLQYNWLLWKNLVIVAFGTLGFSTGTYAAIKAILDVKFA